MRVGVFSDDLAGIAVALLVARGLASIGERVDVLADRGQDLTSEDVPGLRVARASRYAIDTAGRDPTRPDGHLILVLGLDTIGEIRTSSSMDVILTAGWDRPSSARALRAARYAADAYDIPRDDDAPPPFPPVWFVPCSHQVDLWTKATLASTGKVCLPFATRVVPFMVPRPGPGGITGLVQGDAPQPVLRSAVLLASVVTAIAADPFARDIDASGLAALMAGQVHGAKSGTGDRLLALAAEYERMDAPPTGEEGRRCPSPNGYRYPASPFPRSSPRRRSADPTRERTGFVARPPLAG